MLCVQGLSPCSASLSMRVLVPAKSSHQVDHCGAGWRGLCRKPCSAICAWELPNDLPLVATYARIGHAWGRLCCDSRLTLDWGPLVGTMMWVEASYHCVSPVAASLSYITGWLQLMPTLAKSTGRTEASCCTPGFCVPLWDFRRIRSESWEVTVTGSSRTACWVGRTVLPG